VAASTDGVLARTERVPYGTFPGQSVFVARRPMSEALDVSEDGVIKGQLARVPVALGEIPSYPVELRPAVQETMKLLGGTFVREVRKCFRRPLRRVWSRGFWERIMRILERSGQSKQANRARGAAVVQSTISRGAVDGELSLEMVLAILVELGIGWNDLLPPPAKEQVSAECYIEAMGYAQRMYESRIHAREIQDHCPSRGEFEYLLWLYREPDWFHLREPCGAGQELHMLQVQRDRIAERVIQKAHARLGQPGANQASNAAERSWGSNAGGGVGRVELERVQAEWGAGYMLAIEAIPYRWSV
jgi:hypothetical protein